MIDLHYHLLPGVDDGVSTLEEAILYAELNKKNQVNHIVCTPHYLDDTYENTKEALLAPFLQLKTELKNRKIDMSLSLSQEVRMSPSLISELEKGNPAFIDKGNKYIHIEFPTMYIPSFSRQIIQDLVLRGHTPIIVHPERNMEFQKNPNSIIEFLEMGALAEVTVPSYIGYFGKKVQKLAVDYVRQGLVQLMASDSHGAKRPVLLIDGYKLMEKKEGSTVVQRFKQNAECIIGGDMVPQFNYEYIKRRKWRF